MSFKIIQEFRKPGFIIIPEGLEKNGVFWLPPLSWSTKKRHNLLKNKFYLPDKSLWEARPCVVKKSRIATYELAEAQEELLLENSNSKGYSMKEDVIILRSDESSEEECLEGQTPTSSLRQFLQSSTSSEVSRPRKHSSDRTQSTECKNPTEDVKLPLANINDDIWNCFQKTSNTANFRCRVQTMQNSASSPTTMTQIPAINIFETSPLNTEPVLRIDKDISLDCESECDDSIGYNTTTEKSSPESSSKILSSILKSQRHHQEEISKQLRELKIYIQNGLSTIFMELETLTQIQYSNSLSSVNPDIYPKKFCIENFKKVSTCEEANRLEKMLMISEFKADMVEKMSNIIGSNGTRIGNGWDCCYDLIETVFQRKFLKICSWTGASTSQMEDAKIAFLKYKNIISFFASVILNADPEFSFERTKQFFKEVLRSSSEFLRQPNRDQNQENGSDKITEDIDQQHHQSKKSIKRKVIEEDESEYSKKQKFLRNNNVFGSKIDKILLAANRVLHTAKELNVDDIEDNDEDENEGDNDDGNGRDSEDDGNEADKEDEPSSVIETE